MLLNLEVSQYLCVVRVLPHHWQRVYVAFEWPVFYSVGAELSERTVGLDWDVWHFLDDDVLDDLVLGQFLFFIGEGLQSC